MWDNLHHRRAHNPPINPCRFHLAQYGYRLFDALPVRLTCVVLRPQQNPGQGDAPLILAKRPRQRGDFPETTFSATTLHFESLWKLPQCGTLCTLASDHLASAVNKTRD